MYLNVNNDDKTSEYICNNKGVADLDGNETFVN